MKKTFLQGLIIVAMFFATWFTVNQINWMKLFKVERATKKTEQKLGDIFWDFFKKSESENKNPFVVNAVDSLVTKVCNENDINRNDIKVHILNSEEVNAFALPDGHLIILKGLITSSENQEEFTGVICHEMAHIRLNHVMKKLIKEVGLSVLISMTTGRAGAEIMKETAKTLSSSAFDRKLGKDADLKAVDYMVKAKINPLPFADFLYKLSDSEPEELKYFTWISTHPESKERAEYIIEYAKEKDEIYKSVLSDSTWTKIQSVLKESESDF